MTTMNNKLDGHFTYARILRFSLPAMGMSLAVLSFTIVDGLLVSNLLGVNALAAVDYVSPFFLVLYAMGFMFGTGGSAQIANLMGKGDMGEARRLFSMIIFYMVIIGAIVGAVLTCCFPWLLRMTGASEDIIPLCVEYGVVLFAFLPAHLFDSTFESLWITCGRVRLGFIISVLNGLLNVLLDLLFMMKFNMGIWGAGLATSLSALLCAFIIIRYFFIRDEDRLYFVRFSLRIRTFLKICFNGVSEMVDSVAENITLLVLNSRLLTLLGVASVAVMGVYVYSISIFMAFFFGLSNSVITIVGYKYGQGRMDELDDLKKKCTVISLAVGIISFVLCNLMAYPISSLFLGYDKELMLQAVWVMHVSSITCLLYGFVLFCASFFTGLGDGLTSAIIAATLSLIAPVAAAYALPAVFGAESLWLSIPAGTIISAVLCVVLMRTRYVKIKERYYLQLKYNLL